MARRRPGLAAARKSVGLTQEMLDERMNVERSTVQRWESGHATPQAWCWPKLGNTLRLSRATLIELLQEPPDQQHSAGPGFDSGTAPFTVLNADDRRHLAIALTDARRYFDGSVVTYFRRKLTVCMADDGQLGPKNVLPVVLGLLGAINKQGREVTPGVRRELLTVGALGAEFAGWLFRDSGDLAAAALWYSQATEWAQEAGDLPVQGYILLRKSQMAYDSRQAVQMLTLAQSALDGPWRLPDRVKAEVTQQEARGLAMVGEPVDLIKRKLDDARVLLARAEQTDAEPDELGSGYDDSIWTLRSASCYIEAGQPRRAADLYNEVLTTNCLSRRDRGYLLARQASALALAGEPDDSAVVGLRSIQLAEATNSTRTERELGRALTALGPWISRPGPRELREALSAQVI
ncbi:MAG: helix-turn-helix domain-containing protein [Micromonosporaceae bacterium]